MSATNFLREIAEPDVVQLEQEYGNERCAYHAVHSVDALAAHIFWELSAVGHVFPATVADDSKYRHYLAQGHSDFKLLRDIAKAQKHVTLIQGNPAVSNASQVSAQSLGWGEARWGEARWGSPPQVAVRTNTGDYRAIEYIARTSLEYLRGLMTQHALI